MNESAHLDTIAIATELARLRPWERDMVVMITGYEQPEDYAGPWPATYAHIGRYIGEKYEGRALSEAAIRYRRDQLYERWAAARLKLRA